MRYRPAKSINFFLLAALCLGGCWAGRGACRGADFPLSPDSLPTIPVQVQLEAQIQRGLHSGTADGDAYFVPPDTFRLEFTYPWGEALLDVRAAGGKLFSVTAAEGIAASAVEAAFAARGAPAVRALFSGWGCGRDTVLYSDSTVTVRVKILGSRERPDLTGANLLK